MVSETTIINYLTAVSSKCENYGLKRITLFKEKSNYVEVGFLKTKIPDIENLKLFIQSKELLFYENLNKWIGRRYKASLRLGEGSSKTGLKEFNNLYKNSIKPLVSEIYVGVNDIVNLLKQQLTALINNNIKLFKSLYNNQFVLNERLQKNCIKNYKKYLSLQSGIVKKLNSPLIKRAVGDILINSATFLIVFNSLILGFALLIIPNAGEFGEYLSLQPFESVIHYLSIAAVTGGVVSLMKRVGLFESLEFSK